jgi:hypothetical protein
MSTADAFRRFQFDYDALKPLDVTTYLTTAPKKYEPTEAAIAERAKAVLAHWAKDSNRHYDRFYAAADSALDSDVTANKLFDLWRAGDTAELGNVLAKSINDELAEMADQYARDEANGVLGSCDERIPL